MQPRKGEIAVFGSVNVDLVIRGPRLPQPGETVIGGDFHSSQGGKGANQAVAAARAGRQKVTFIGAVGDDDFGRAARESLAREGIDGSLLKTVPDRPTGIALILVDETGENLISVASGANGAFIPEEVDALPQAVFDRAAVLVTNLELPPGSVRRALRRARSCGVTTVLNPAPANQCIVKEGWLTDVDVLTPNRTEAAHLTGFACESEADAIACARELRRLGCRRVIVTLGSKGCVVVDDEVTTLAAHKVTAVDATAAGDAFTGALAAALAEGRSFREAATWANAAAALAVTKSGAQPSIPSRSEIERLVG